MGIHGAGARGEGGYLNALNILAGKPRKEQERGEAELRPHSTPGDAAC